MTGVHTPTRLGTEAKTKFSQRLKKEGRWQQYVKERDEIAEARNTTTTNAHNEIYHRYAPEGEVVAPPVGDKAKTTTVHEEAYADKLPNGCPLFDQTVWHGKTQTNLLDDVQWVAAHLGLKDFDYINSSPSLRACTLYWEARYTVVGQARYQELLRQLEVPDKATLKQLNSRKDDGAELGRLTDFMTNYQKHQEEQEKDG
jgi:hypothetical protein